MGKRERYTLSSRSSSPSSCGLATFHRETKRSRGFYRVLDAAHEKFAAKLSELSPREPPTLRPLSTASLFLALSREGLRVCIKKMSCRAFARVTALRWMSFLFSLIFLSSAVARQFGY